MSRVRGNSQGPGRGGLGGAANWAGTEHERLVVAYIVAHVVAQAPLEGLGWRGAVPTGIRLQADSPIDDVVCEFDGGRVAYMQVRRTLGWAQSRATGIRWVIHQWEGLARSERVDPRRHRLVAVYDRGAPLVHVLDEQLGRSRASRRETDTAEQAEQMRRVEELLANLSAQDRRRLLSAARLWRIGVLDRASPAVTLALELLRTHVTIEAHARSAWNALAALAGEGARLRRGFDRDELLDALRAEDVPLRRDRAGSAGARRAALVRHRDRLVRLGAQLRFTGLLATVPAVSAVDADAEVRVVEANPSHRPDREWGHELWWVLRRRTRVLLTGLPGGGKSTALSRTAAEYAGRRNWPVPIVIRLDRLDRELGSASLRDALLTLATEEASSTDRPLLRDELERRLEQGRIALLFDGLDECGRHRHELLRTVQSFLAGVPSDAEVLLATRDAAYADACVLGFTDARLLPPREPVAPVRAVLEALAGTRGVEAPDRWVQRRVEWVDKAIGADQTLKETPLIPILLAELAAQQQDEHLPRERAVIMRRAVESVVERWETGKPQRARLGVLDGRRASRALLASFVFIGRFLSGNPAPTRSAVADLLAAELGAQLTLAPLESSVVADEALDFWDQSGFFVMQGGAEELVPRIRLFAELADALATLDAEESAQREWAAATVLNPDRREALAMASDLSRAVVDAAFQSAAERGDASVLLRAMNLPGAPNASAAARRALVEALIGRADRADEDRRWECAVGAIRLADRGARPRLTRLLSAWPAPGQRTLLEALMVVALELSGRRADDRLRAVLELDRIETVPALGHGPLAWFLADDIHGHLVVHAARRLLRSEPGLAEAVAAHLQSTRGSEGAREVLAEAGRQDLVDAADDLAQQQHEQAAKDHGSRWKYMPDVPAADLQIVTWIGAYATPKRLTWHEKRNAETLADLWATLSLPHVRSLEPASVLESPSEAPSAEAVLAVVSRLSGLDLRIAAAQARFVAAEGADPHDVHHLLGVRGRSCAAREWDWSNISASRPAIAELIHGLHIRTWIAGLSFHALLTAPLRPSDRDALAVVAREARRYENRSWAACLHCVRAPAGDPDRMAAEWLREGEPGARSGVASYVSARLKSDEPDPGQLLRQLLDDPDDEVRAHFLKALKGEKLTSSSLEAVRAGDWKPRPWVCSNCQTANASGSSSCRRCSHVLGDARAAAEALLRHAANSHNLHP